MQTVQHNETLQANCLLTYLAWKNWEPGWCSWFTRELYLQVLLYPFVIQRLIKKYSEFTCSGIAVNAL
jgi:hypothetical protein